ncbi:MAG TPA: NAD(P)/FAD-dependent oxidoreductase [Polyangiaceae bacterium]|nr:NAD(P)/FAD-dependent oxidoreductase [Polyangiaceae bacterium]
MNDKATKTRVLIVGGGPAGLTLACALANRSAISVTLAEHEPDPFTAPTTTDRSYTIDITGHGLKAIQYLDAVEAFNENLIRFRGVEIQRPIKHRIPWEGLGWTGSRGDILRALYGDLLAKHPDRIHFLWETIVRDIDPLAGTAKVGDTRQRFDLIVGCDGAGSPTRQALEALPDFTVERFTLPNYCMMIRLDQNTERLDPEYLQIKSGHPMVVAGAVNGRDKNDPQWFCMVGFNHEHVFGGGDGPESDKAVAEARAYFERHTDIMQYVSEDELRAFVKRKCHHIGKAVRCSTLNKGKIVLLGDAGAPFPPIGQGINAAMEAAVVLDEAIGETGGGETPEQLLQAADAFTVKWKPEADAATWIATRWTFSSLGASVRVFIAELFGVSVLNQAKHKPYSEVYRQAKKRFGPFGKYTEPKPDENPQW